MAEIPLGTYSASLAILAQKGLRYGTVFDVGCAEGNFFVQHYVMGVFQDSVAVNIDASAEYEPALKQVQDAVGGHFMIAAVVDQPGEIAINASRDPAWRSVRPPGDPYWQRLNNMVGEQFRVPAVTLDQVATNLKLEPPYLIKLDIQGAEVAALRGAKTVLGDTSVVICEADIADFHAIDRALVDAGFHLFDLTQINRVADHSLAWFYPVYINRKHRGLLRRALWDTAENEQRAQQQVERRRTIHEWHEKVLPQIRAARMGGQ